MNAGNVAVGSTPSSRTRRDVNSDTVRTASTRRTAQRATASATGLRTRRAREPYSRVAVRQSPCTSSTMGTRLRARSEEHTSELQSRQYLVCRLLLEKKK